MQPAIDVFEILAFTLSVTLFPHPHRTVNKMDGRPKQLQNKDRAPPTQVCQVRSVSGQRANLPNADRREYCLSEMLW